MYFTLRNYIIALYGQDDVGLVVRTLSSLSAVLSVAMVQGGLRVYQSGVGWMCWVLVAAHQEYRITGCSNQYFQSQGKLSEN